MRPFCQLTGQEHLSEEFSGKIPDFSKYENFEEAQGKVLIELDGELEDVICSEPAIRSFKSEAGEGVEISVSSKHGDLFLGNPCVSEVIDPDHCDSREDYDVCFKLSREIGLEYEPTHLVDWYGRGLAVMVEDVCPQIYLDSFDHISAQKYGIGSMGHPRIAIASYSSHPFLRWGKEKWSLLCELLVEKLNASIIQLGEQGDEFLGFGEDILGKATARESASIISNCDLLIGIDNGYSHLAAAMKTPCVLLFGPSNPAMRMHPGVGIGISCQECECRGCVHYLEDASRSGRCVRGNNECMNGISVAKVIESIIGLCRNNNNQ